MLIRGTTAALVIGTVAACAKQPETVADTTAKVIALGVENIAIVKQGTLESGPAISGALTPEHQATVRAEIGGPVLATSADAGQRVTRGTLLARLDDAELQVAHLSAKSGIASADLNAELSKREEERATKLAAAGAISDRELEQARRVNTAAQAQLADARSRLALAEKQLASARIVAPFTGSITEKHVSAGDVVQPGGALFTIIDPASMRLEASLPASELNQIKSGAVVHFTVSGYGNRAFTGRVSRVNPAADPTTGQIKVTVSVPNAGQGLVSGLFAEGRISTQSRNTLLAPATAVNVAGATPSVMRIRNGQAEKVDVTIGSRDPATETVEIVAGVTAGDTLILGSGQGMPVGTPVRIESRGDAGSRPPASGGGQ